MSQKGICLVSKFEQGPSTLKSQEVQDVEHIVKSHLICHFDLLLYYLLDCVYSRAENSPPLINDCTYLHSLLGLCQKTKANIIIIFSKPYDFFLSPQSNFPSFLSCVVLNLFTILMLGGLIKFHQLQILNSVNC